MVVRDYVPLSRIWALNAYTSIGYVSSPTTLDLPQELMRPLFFPEA